MTLTAFIAGLAIGSAATAYALKRVLRYRDAPAIASAALWRIMDHPQGTVETSAIARKALTDIEYDRKETCATY